MINRMLQPAAILRLWAAAIVDTSLRTAVPYLMQGFIGMESGEHARRHSSYYHSSSALCRSLAWDCLARHGPLSRGGDSDGSRGARHHPAAFGHSCCS